MMKKRSLKHRLSARLVAGLTLLALTSAARAQMPSPGTAETRLLELLKKSYPATQFTSAQRAVGLPGMFEVVMGQNIAYVDETGRYFLIGRLFDMQTRTDITAETKERIAPRIEWASLPLGDAIRFGSGPLKVAVFSDPDCPFCRQLEVELEKLENVSVYVFPYPIASLHPGASRVAKAIWCAPDKGRAWRDYLLRKVQPPQPQKDCNADAIMRNVELASRYGIAATPTLLSAEGRLVSGASKAEQILSWLERSN